MSNSPATQSPVEPTTGPVSQPHPASVSDAELAGALVREAGVLAAEMRTTGVQSERKTSVTDIVTSADRAAEALITARLALVRPDDGILGEEGARRVGRSDRAWIIDPVDGTYNFLTGLGWWCSAVALSRAHDVLLGAVYQPQTDELWVGGPDHPTTCNGQPVGPLPDAPLREVSLATYLHPTRFTVPDAIKPFTALIRCAATIRMLGSGSLELANVAAGRLGVYCHHSAPAWDWQPGEALVRGVGGQVEQVHHRGFTWSLAGPPTAVAEAAAALRSA